MFTCTDQLQRTIHLREIPQRIVSLVPSQTELLVDVGAGEQLVGVTNYCIHPKKITKKIKKVGGTKDFDLRKIRTLEPDLIIANKEENTKELINELEKDYPVWVSDVNDLHSALEMICAVGKLVGHGQKAVTLAEQIRCSFIEYTAKHSCFVRQRVIYLIWNEPLMAVGSGTFIAEMLRIAGFDNALQQSRYPQLTSEDIQRLRPDCIFLSSEPYPFKEKHRREFSSVFPFAHVQLVDGELFSWYGSRLQYSAAYFAQLQKILKKELV